jgi:glucosylceramidase
MALHFLSACGCEENAFSTPSGNVVVIVLNNSASFKTFNIKLGNDIVKTYLSAGAVATYIW